jgi:hypothetical protein
MRQLYKPDSELLDQSIKRNGGINACAARFTRRLGWFGAPAGEPFCELLYGQPNPSPRGPKGGQIGHPCANQGWVVGGAGCRRRLWRLFPQKGGGRKTEIAEFAIEVA